MRCILIGKPRWLFGILLFALLPAVSIAETVTLKNGSVLTGSVGPIASVGADPLQAGGAGEVQLKRIVIIDDQLRRVFVGTNQVLRIDPVAAKSTVKFIIPQRVGIAGRLIGGVGPIVHVTPFDEFGRRTFTMNTSEGHVSIVQAITEITPVYTKVEAVQGAGSFVWTMRIATSSIPYQTLSKILYRHIDPKNADQRLQIVLLYMQAERVQDARLELGELIKDFPALAHLQTQLVTLNQQAAQRLIREIELRRDSGQPRLAITMLQKFPGEGVAGETLLKVREMLGDFEETNKLGDRVFKLIDLHASQLKGDKPREELEPILAEIKAELTIHTLDRMADYVRLSDDPALTAEQKLSLAISGWLLGSGGGLDNLAVSKSLVQVRTLVRRYMLSSRKPERDAILGELTSLEGATPAYLAKIIAHMKPPLETDLAPASADVGDVEAAFGPPALEKEPEKPAPPTVPNPADAKPAEPERAVRPMPVDTCDPGAGILDGGPNLPKLPKALPRGAAAPAAIGGVAGKVELASATGEAKPPAINSPPGLLKRTVAGLAEDPEITYYVQLPPEYNPYRRYPCVVTLNGAGTTPLQQIDWWAGSYNADAQDRFGQATRHGYIVIAPRWTREHQRKYEYTAREHAAVLRSLRDATKRFSIDTDRVFLSGHSMGGDAVWDIGLAHPDLWAGVIPIVATADKYVTRYWQNGAYVPFYFVCGEKDGNKLALNAMDWDRYLTHRGFDTMIAQYQGRGHEHFHDEIQHLFDWMNLHKRNFFPREFEAVSMRPWDNFFWWIETAKPLAATQVLPAEWPKSVGIIKPTEAKILETNSVRVDSPAASVTVWLAPEMVSFDSKVTAIINNRRQLNITPSPEVLLEDVRTRGDRQHPFWAKAQN